MPVTAPSRRLLAIVAACALSLVPVAGSAQEESAEPVPSSAPTHAPVPLATSPEGSWIVGSFDAWEQGLVEPRPNSRLTVSLLDDGQLEGETGCGRFSGGWSLDDGELFVGLAPTSHLDCSEKKVGEAIGLSTALAAVVGWQATDAGLELLDASDSTRVILRATAISEPAGAWAVQRYRRPNGQLVEPLPEQAMTMTLSADGDVEGSTGCRLLLGAYASDGTGIRLGPLETQGKPCKGDERKAERQLLRALGDAVYWQREGEALTLLDGFDEPLVELIRVPQATVETEAQE